MNVNVEKYIPHRGRMRLIDEVIDVTSNGAVCKAYVSDTWPSLENGKINNLMMVELVAQSTSFCIGWKNSKDGDGNENGNQGWLVGIKRATIKDNVIKSNSELIVTVDFKNSYSDLYVVSEGTVEYNNEEIARVIIQAVKAD